MSNRMLIDATHPEETRVVVLRGNRVEEFDFEAADRQQLRGNIYLAKVTRVEPSLQAAFVDYGGNRHGFLAFSEIHPDYYQIPYADRQALLQEQAREEAEQAAEEAELDDAAEAASDAGAETARAAEEAFSAGDDAEAPPERGAEASERASEPSQEAPVESAEAAREPDTEAPEAPAPAAPPAMTADVSSDMVAEAPTEASESAGPSASLSQEGESESIPATTARGNVDEVDTDRDEAEMVESVGAEDALEEVPERRKPRPRQSKIQEVIKRRQVMLVQVVKEERGNKGAALTTYLSLAGRYSVLMPNTGRGGGISRKITNPADRKRLKAIASELDVPEGMGVILRTAGANRTKAEVKRDFEYLLRLWENVRELTLRSTAPKLVYEEGSLIKRSIRDLYSKEIDQIIVAGDDAYREAKDFMRMLTPSHARHVQVYKEDTPIFARNGVEAQLDAMFSPQVTLRSGGYIVINQTEALVSIDVNSGRSTREHSIEDTALNTNLEAAEEIARQLRLRDLAGLIVIDFIDMEEKRNNRSVERKLKDCLRADRARIQVGRISHFGLLEMSRQRIRTGVLESSVVPCPHCRGTGQVRSIASLSLQILRALEDQLLRNSGYHLFVHTRPEAALYVLNQKRQHLAQLEARFGIAITVSGEPPEDGGGYAIERGAPVEDRAERPILATAEMPPLPDEEEAEDEDIEVRRDEETEEGRDRRRRRRRRRGNGDDRHERYQAAESEVEPEAEVDEAEEAEEELEPGREAEADASGQDQRRRRRGRRGGRRRGRGREQGEFGGNGETVRDRPPGEPTFARDEGAAEAAPYSETSGEWAGTELSAEASAAPFAERPEPAAFDEPIDSSPTVDDAEPVAATVDASEAARDVAESAREEVEPAAAAEAARADIEETAAAETASPQPARDAVPAERSAPADEPAPPPPEDDRPKRSGWWSRKSSFF